MFAWFLIWPQYNPGEKCNARFCGHITFTVCLMVSKVNRCQGSIRAVDMNPHKPRWVKAKGLGIVAYSLNKLFGSRLCSYLQISLLLRGRTAEPYISSPLHSHGLGGQLVKDNYISHMVKSCICHYQRYSMWRINLSGRMWQLKESN